MISSQRKKRLYLAAGLVIVLIFGLLWHAAQFRQGARSPGKPHGSADASIRSLPPQPAAVLRRISALGPGEAHAADSAPPALVRKKLPAPVPEALPRAAPLPAPTGASEPAAPGQEKPNAASAPEPAPPAAASMPELGPVLVPPAAPPAKAEPSRLEPKPGPGARAAYPFSVLLSSCREKQNALAALSSYRQAGLTPYIVQTDLGSKGLWWRTLTGYYRTQAEAVQAKNALKRFEAVVVKTPFANQIGQYGSETEAGEAAARVALKEVFPYIVKGPGNSFQLMAGAFPSQQAAEMHRRELDAMGVSTRTVQR
jgi:hypothetical protein